MESRYNNIFSKFPKRELSKEEIKKIYDTMKNNKIERKKEYEKIFIDIFKSAVFGTSNYEYGMYNYYYSGKYDCMVIELQRTFDICCSFKRIGIELGFHCEIYETKTNCYIIKIYDKEIEDLTNKRCICCGQDYICNDCIIPSILQFHAKANFENTKNL